MGISNTLGTIPGIISPSITGYLVEDKSVESWQRVFLICGFIYLLGAIFYAIFASGERQEWSKINEDDELVRGFVSENKSSGVNFSVFSDYRNGFDCTDQRSKRTRKRIWDQSMKKCITILIFFSPPKIKYVTYQRIVALLGVFKESC